jgi:hypothetical protein
MSAIADFVVAPVVAPVEPPVAAAPKYRTHYTRSWHAYQQIAPSHLHSIDHYNSECEEYAKLYDDHVMVLREHVTKITGWYYCTGWSPQNCAETDGYVDVRTGKKYTLQGENSFFKDIGGCPPPNGGS